MHTPVLLKEILQMFDPKPGEMYIDATVNGGGHAEAIAERVGPTGKVVGIDWDADAIENLQKKFSNRKVFQFICSNYVDIAHIVKSNHLDAPRGILFDLGFSSNQLEASGRGFSFLKDEPLDMRYNIHGALTAEKIINTWTEKAIADIFRRFGEERFARRYARAVCAERARRPIRTTREFARIIERSAPRRSVNGRIHPATRVFQALRIAVNDELKNVERGVRAAIDEAAPGGRIAVITFHSLEDRIVKHIFQERKNDGTVKIVTPKPIIASKEEIRENPRSRSAKLRAVEKL